MSTRLQGTDEGVQAFFDYWSNNRVQAEVEFRRMWDEEVARRNAAVEARRRSFRVIDGGRKPRTARKGYL